MKDKYDKKLAQFLSDTNPIFKEVISQADSENDRPYAIAEFSSYAEMSELVEEITGIQYQSKERFQRVIATMEQAGIMEIEEFNEETGYLRCKMFLPGSGFDDIKN